MRTVTAQGLGSSSEPQDRRYSIVPLHNATQALAEQLVVMWAEKTPEEAYEVTHPMGPLRPSCPHGIYPHEPSMATHPLKPRGTPPGTPRQVLRQPDVVVTNQRDKDVQLPKLKKLQALTLKLIAKAQSS